MTGQKQVLVQQQHLKLSPQLVQSIKLMAMPFSDLRERILEEAEKNPALEIVSDPFESASLQPASGSAASPVYQPEGYDAGDYASGDYTPGDYTPGDYPSAGGDEASDNHRDFIEGALHRESTLQESLLAQLSDLDLDAPVRDLAALIIQNLDRDGFHEVPPSGLPGGDEPAVLGAALAAVRGLDPRGCACSNFHESLVVQARLLAPPGPDRDGTGPVSDTLRVADPLLAATIEILQDHFSLLEKGRAEALVRALAKNPVPGLDLDEEDAEGVFGIVRSLDPFPGRSLDPGKGSYIVPDVIVRKTEDEYSVLINEEEIPVLGLSPFFMDLEKGGDGDTDSVEPKKGSPGDAAARDFVRESVREARWFMSSLSRRNLTILKLARALVVFQRDFFVHGPSRLAPLRMKDIAAEIGLHEATVSRAASGKYLQCEWGLFELRYFFSNQVGQARSPLPVWSGAETIPAGTPAAASYTSSRYSKQGVKEIVRQIIGESDTALSDQKIADELAHRGIRIARRTVAKYRSELTIKSSFER